MKAKASKTNKQLSEIRKMAINDMKEMGTDILFLTFQKPIINTLKLS